MQWTVGTRSRDVCVKGGKDLEEVRQGVIYLTKIAANPRELRRPTNRPPQEELEAACHGRVCNGNDEDDCQLGDSWKKGKGFKEHRDGVDAAAVIFGI